MRYAKYIVHSPVFRDYMRNRFNLTEEHTYNLLKHRFGDSTCFTDQELCDMLLECELTIKVLLERTDVLKLFTEACGDERTGLLFLYELCYTDDFRHTLRRSPSEVKAMLQHHYEANNSPFTDEDTLYNKIKDFDQGYFSNLIDDIKSWACYLHSINSGVITVIYKLFKLYEQYDTTCFDPIESIPEDKLIECLSDYETCLMLNHVAWGSDREKYSASMAEALCIFFLNMSKAHPLYDSNPRQLIHDLCKYGFDREEITV